VSPGLAGPSPHMIAIEWAVDARVPEACHRSRKITASPVEENVRRIDPRPRGDWYGIAEDSAQVCRRSSSGALRPYSNELFRLRARRARCMCGQSRHPTRCSRAT
jgi:hypothetical protein